MEKTYVMLTSGTCGTVDEAPLIGQVVTIDLHDENGKPILETGTVEEIL